MRLRRKHSIGNHLVFGPCLAGGLYFLLVPVYAVFVFWRRGEEQFGVFLFLGSWVAAALLLGIASMSLRGWRKHHVYRISSKHADGTLTLRPVPKHSDDSSQEPNITLTLSHSPLCLGQRFTAQLGGDTAGVIGDRAARLVLRCQEDVTVDLPTSTPKYANIFYEDAQEFPDHEAHGRGRWARITHALLRSNRPYADA